MTADPTGGCAGARSLLDGAYEVDEFDDRVVSDFRLSHTRFDMIASFLLFAVGMAQQAPRTEPVFTGGDYPEEAIRRGEEGTAFVLLLIDTAGHVDTCTILESSGYPDLDRQTCKVIQAHAKFVPAKDDSGSSVFALHRIPVTWVLGHRPDVKVNPAFDIAVNHGPPGVKLPLSMTISYFVSPGGAVTKCHPTEAEAPAQLVALACKMALTTPYGAMRDHLGKPVTAMENVTVRFDVKR